MISVRQPSRVFVQQFARDVVITRLTMHRRTVLGNTNKEPINQNSPVMHCERLFFTSL